MLDPIKYALESLSDQEPQLKNALLAGVLIKAWVRLFSGPVAKNSIPVGVNKGILVVETSSSSWAHQLELMKEEILQKISELLGEGRLTGIRFKPGNRKIEYFDKRVKPKSESSIPATPESLLEKQNENQRALKRAGGKTCQKCGMVFLQNDKVCHFCKRTEEIEKEQKVNKIINEAPWLSYQEIKRENENIDRVEFDKVRKDKKLRAIEDLYKMSWGFLENGFGKRDKETFTRIAHEYVMLKTQRNPKEISDKVVSANLPAKVRLIWQKINQDMTPQT